MNTKTAAVFLSIAIAVGFISYNVGFRHGERARSAGRQQTRFAPAHFTNRNNSTANQQALLGSIDLTNTETLVGYDVKPAVRRRSFIRSSHPASLSPATILIRQEGADDFEAEAMNDYRLRWELQLRNSGQPREPLFNPSATERLFVP